MRWKFQPFGCFKYGPINLIETNFMQRKNVSLKVNECDIKKLSYVSILDPHIRQQLPKVPNAQCGQNFYEVGSKFL